MMPRSRQPNQERTDETIVQSIDWMPTLLEMARIPMPAKAKPDGQSIVPALMGGGLKEMQSTGFL
ncbi:MAG: hypothetical protein WCO60_16240 [Verrucomicrobiota bacterium]